MPNVTLPDGSIAQFPDGMPEDEIAQALKRGFPHRHCQILHLTDVDWHVVSREGIALGYRKTIAEAIALANSLPPLQQRRTPPSPRQPTLTADGLCPWAGVARAEARQRGAEIRERIKRYRRRGRP